ncbi:hypothetical protein AVO41_01155 [Thiomicrospira sp. WB1]|nr:hypothetical protein AVO41_01155 [Thiomicrospira sp. WB1]
MKGAINVLLTLGIQIMVMLDQIQIFILTSIVALDLISIFEIMPICIFVKRLFLSGKKKVTVLQCKNVQPQ